MYAKIMYYMMFMLIALFFCTRECARFDRICAARGRSMEKTRLDLNFHHHFLMLHSVKTV